jgi:ribonuclease T1
MTTTDKKRAANIKLILLVLGIVALLALRWYKNRPIEGKTDQTSTTSSSKSKNSGSSTGRKLPSDVPEQAFKTLEYAQSNNGEARKGYKGNVKFSNRENRLPRTSAPFKEYDIHRWVKGKNRGPERVVIGNDGKAWYTSNHYKTFKLLN